MQSNSFYLYPNKVDVFTNLGDWTTGRYRRVYQRNFKVYRGVDNRLDFQVRNADEKAKDITGNTLVFNLVERETQKLVLQQECILIPDADLSKTTRGYTVITETVLNNLDKGFYTYALYIVNAQGFKTPLYSDSQYGGTGTLEVHGDIFGEPQDSVIVDTFKQIPVTWPNDGISRSEFIYGTPEVRSQGSLHTFVFYSTNYEGQVTIQGSQETGGTPSVWTTLATIDFPVTEQYYNIVGKHNYFRITHDPATSNTGTFDKVVYR